MKIYTLVLGDSLQERNTSDQEVVAITGVADSEIARMSHGGLTSKVTGQASDAVMIPELEE